MRVLPGQRIDRGDRAGIVGDDVQGLLGGAGGRGARRRFDLGGRGFHLGHVGPAEDEPPEEGDRADREPARDQIQYRFDEARFGDGRLDDLLG
jgi:hypothetical protein